MQLPPDFFRGRMRMSWKEKRKKERTSGCEERENVPGVLPAG